MHKTTFKKGQGAVEYLLVIGAVILVTAVVILALSGTLTETRSAIDNNEVANLNDPLQNLLHNSYNPSSNEPTYNLNNLQIHYLELDLQADAIALGDLLENAPNYTYVEVDTNYYKKLAGPFECLKQGSWVNCESDLILPGTKFKINLINSATGFDINEDITNIVLENYAELTLSTSAGEKYLYFTPTQNSITSILSDAPNGAYVTIKNAQNEELLVAYRKTSGVWNKEYDLDNDLFDTLEQDDNAIINLNDNPSGIIGNYSKKITGTVNQNFNALTLKITTEATEFINYQGKTFILGNAAKCYDINKLFNKVETTLGTNFHVTVNSCTKGKTDNTLGEYDFSNIYYCQNLNKSIASSDIIGLGFGTLPPTPLPVINFECN